MAKKITIGEYVFSTKTEAKQAIQKILNGHQLGDTLIGEEDSFIRDMIALHPAADHKIGCGINHIEVRPDPSHGTTRCFYIVRVDGSSTDVGYIKCIDGENRRGLLRSALRIAILPQIVSFKKEQFATGSQTCLYTKELLRFESCHVDHTPPMIFEALIAGWLNVNNLTEFDIQLTERQDNSSTRLLANAIQCNSWTAYHQQHARLRIVSRLGNLSHAKIEAGSS